MNIREISKPVTAKSLNESLQKKFGQRINIESFTLEQLQDARNRIRTKLSQVETNESFDSVHNETYQKSKLFLDVLNAAISEREDVDIEEKAVSKSQQQAAGAALAAKRKGDTKGLKGSSKEMAKMSTKELEKIAGTKHKGLPDKKDESVVREGAEDQAEIVMAAKDMVDRLTGWMEDTAEMQTDSMLELADAIRDEMGDAQSQEFVQMIKPALESLYQSMEQTRGILTQGVGLLTGEQSAMDTMGADDDMDMEPTTDGDLDMGDETADAGIDTEFDFDDAGDDFGADATGAGGEEEAGRAKRESKNNNKKKIAERSRRLASTLSKKK